MAAPAAALSPVTPGALAMVVQAAYGRPAASATAWASSPCFSRRQGAQALLAPAVRRPGRPIFPSLCGQHTAVLAPHSSTYGHKRQGRSVERARRPTPPSSTAPPWRTPPRLRLGGVPAPPGLRTNGHKGTPVNAAIG